MAIKPVTVSQLNDYISRILNTDPLLGNVIVKGEISSVKYHSVGHVYMSIVDENSKISCFIHSSYVENLRFQLVDGMEITAIGSVKIFKKNGTYSLNIKNIEVSGDGNLAIAFETLKNKLKAEGIFDSGHKKPIPAFPSKIGVVTSETGAAIRDILKTVQLRNNITDIILFPVLVQGNGAAKNIADTIDFINANYFDIDTLIVGRGGGSAEELWTFNEEILARSIYKSRIPVISSVGHEIDFTISDMVADLRAATPTAAAVAAVPDIRELANTLKELKNQLSTHMSNKFMYNKLLTNSLLNEMLGSLKNKFNSALRDVEKYKLILEENNPLTILEKGYTVIEDCNRNLVTAPDEISADKTYRITFEKGMGYYKLLQVGSDINGKK